MSGRSAAFVSLQSTSWPSFAKIQLRELRGMHIMTESAADGTAVENAYRDIDRYVSETSQPSSSDAQSLSPSQRLRLLGMQQAGRTKTPSDEQGTTTALSANEF
jgi:hypothetical protein